MLRNRRKLGQHVCGFLTSTPTLVLLVHLDDLLNDLSFFHFPPFGPGGEASPLLELAAGAHPQAIVYGHLHGADPAKLPQSYRGIPLHLVAADALRFRPKLVLEAD